MQMELLETAQQPEWPGLPEAGHVGYVQMCDVLPQMRFLSLLSPLSPAQTGCPAPRQLPPGQGSASGCVGLAAVNDKRRLLIAF